MTSKYVVILDENKQNITNQKGEMLIQDMTSKKLLYVPVEYEPPQKIQKIAKYNQTELLQKRQQTTQMELLQETSHNYSDSPKENLREVSDNDFDIEDNYKQEQNRWSHSAVIRLIEQYKNNIKSFKSTVIRNETVWKTISSELAEDGYTFTPKQCGFKFKNLKKKYQAKVDYMKATASGAAPIHFEYYDLFHDIFGQKPNINPVAIASSSRSSGIEIDMEEQQSVLEDGIEDTKYHKTKETIVQRGIKKTKVERILQELKDMNTIKEEERNRRHAELINMQCEAIKVFGEKMEKLIDKLP